MSANDIEMQQQLANEGANFILRRAVPFSPKPSGKFRGEVAVKCDDYERSSTLEDRSRQVVNDGRCDSKLGRDIGHKTVIYFGDSNPRRREDRARQQSSPEAAPPATSRCRNADPPLEASLRPRNDKILLDSAEQDGSENDDVGRRDSVTENGDPKVVHEIVVNVSPSREDVLRIEEDESQLEDYWSLPGDTSGFKADWSFVQQWRLRG